jgi:TRAP-type C4-dicarboxylate transport system permease small subunit
VAKLTLSEKVISRTQTANRALGRIEGVITAFVFAIMMGAMILQVVSRFVLHIPMPWTEEFARYAFIAVGFIGSAVAIQDHQHIEIDIVSTLVDKIKSQRTIDTINKILGFIKYITITLLSAYICSLCWEFTLKVQQMGQRTPALQLPTWILDLIITAGWFLICIHSLSKCVVIILDRRERHNGKGGETK